MTIVQIITSFVALVVSAYLIVKLRFGSLTPLHCLMWAAAVVACVVSFVGIR